MGLFSRNKPKTNSESPAPVSDPNAAAEGVDPLANFKDEAAAPTNFKKKVPTPEQKAWFNSLQNERAAKIRGGGRPSIAGILEQSGLMHSEMIDEVIRQSGEEAASVKRTVVTQGHMTEGDFLNALAEGLGMEQVDLNRVEITEELLAQIDKKTAKEFKCFPVKFTETELWVAVADPMNIQVTDDLATITRKQIHPMVAREEDIFKKYKSSYEKSQVSDLMKAVHQEVLDKEEAIQDDGQAISLDIAADQENVPPVVRFVDLIFRQAVHDRASDIHIEPTKTGVTIRFRIDGVLHEVPSPPKKWQNAIVGRLKVMSSMDLSEKRIPQDGRIKLNLPDRKLDLRVSLLPSIHGESIVMRILDQSSVMLGLEDVGFLPDNITLFRNLIKTPTGVILMTGPTGSGKTTTLYSALSTLNTPEAKIITIENPVEYMLEGINQIQVNEEVGLDFTKGLRAMLRQSPDVILVGEIRDKETAEIAVRAALTGHLVFSTLHTNDAPTATTRLTDMGIKPFLVASSIQAVIAQRLVRRLCAHCKRVEHIDVKDIEAIGAKDEELANGIDACLPVGCDRCGGKGYRGRTAIHEIFVMNARLRQLVIRGEPASRLKKLAIKEGMRSLRMDGFRKVVRHDTSIEELNRVTATE